MTFHFQVCAHTHTQSLISTTDWTVWAKDTKHMNIFIILLLLEIVLLKLWTDLYLWNCCKYLSVAVNQVKSDISNGFHYCTQSSYSSEVKS